MHYTLARVLLVAIQPNNIVTIKTQEEICKEMYLNTYSAVHHGIFPNAIHEHKWIFFTFDQTKNMSWIRQRAYMTKLGFS